MNANLFSTANGSPIEAMTERPPIVWGAPTASERRRLLTAVGREPGLGGELLCRFFRAIELNVLENELRTDSEYRALRRGK